MPKKIENPDDLFDITVSAVRPVGRVTFRPNGTVYRVKRKVMDAIGDAVATRSAVADPEAPAA